MQGRVVDLSRTKGGGGGGTPLSGLNKYLLDIVFKGLRFSLL